MVFLWFSGFPMVFLRFSYGFPMVFPAARLLLIRCLAATLPGPLEVFVTACGVEENHGFIGYIKGILTGYLT